MNNTTIRELKELYILEVERIANKCLYKYDIPQEVKEYIDSPLTALVVILCTDSDYWRKNNDAVNAMCSDVMKCMSNNLSESVLCFEYSEE
ncbi:MAG: hypothetical protein AABY32_01615 [Nanoarchaeota archaeon]